MLTLLLIALPVVSALLLLALSGENVKRVAFVASLAEFALALVAASQVAPEAGSQLAVSYPWIESAGIRFSVGMDGISLLLVILTTLLVPLIVLTTFGHSYQNPAAFYALVLFMEAALVGVFTARDAFLFYLFWEAALIPVYFLAGIWGGKDRIRITFKFFLYTIFGSLFMLLAFAYLYFQTPGAHSADVNALYALNLDAGEQSWLFWALFIAFAVKMPVFPFHTWQPDTYVESPAPATMLLSGIMLKMGIYGLIRWLLPVVPEGVDQWGATAMILSIVGIVYGSVIAVQQNDMKRLVAYSSLAHVGLMSAGVFTRTTSGLQGAVIQMLAHGINVVGLFFIIDIITRRTKTRDLERLGGITQQTPALTVCFVILMLGSVALPLTSGFVGEFLLLSGLYTYNPWYGAIAGLTIILGAVYLLRMFQKAMLGPKIEAAAPFADLTFLEKAVLFPLVFMVFWIGLYPNSFLNLTGPAVADILRLTANGATGLK
ncbi:MAG: NADH-quinone oxidoreductase subunit M [Ferruginibacter sp.]|nr:NADH-quinone oxidoreductase subunit M [Cytophagales bacterium]